MDYDALGHFADSWGLVFLSVMFIVAVLWVFRPGSTRIYREQAQIPLKHDLQKD